MEQDYKINNLREELMQEIKDIKKSVGCIEIQIAKLPEVLSDKFDSKYAGKAIETNVNELSKKVESLKEKSEQRNYEWLKYLIMLGVGALLAYFGLN